MIAVNGEINNSQRLSTPGNDRAAVQAILASLRARKDDRAMHMVAFEGLDLGRDMTRLFINHPKIWSLSLKNECTAIALERLQGCYWETCIHMLRILSQQDINVANEPIYTCTYLKKDGHLSRLHHVLKF